MNRSMNKALHKQQAQIQKFLEEWLPEHYEELIHDTLSTLDSALDSTKSSARSATSHLNMERGKLESKGRDALDALDRDKLEGWLRDSIRNLDADKLERWARKSLNSMDRDKLQRLLRDRLGGLDKSALESLLKESVKQIDRRKLESKVRDRVTRLDLDKIKSAARARLSELDTSKIESLVSERFDIRGFVNERVDNVLRARLDALSTDDLERLLDSKRAAIEAETRSKKGKAIKKADLAAMDKNGAKKGTNPVSALFGTLGRLAFFGAAGWIAYSHLFLEHQVPLPKAIAAELLTLAYRASGPLNIYQDRSGSGRPIVLIHSINAAASSYEMRPLFQHYRGKRPVYSLDLPGFGFSARPSIEYTPEIYVNAILTMLEGIGGQAADVVALSLGSEFAAEAARRRPELFHSLTLLSPTGMMQKGSEQSSQAAGGTGLDQVAYPLLSFRLWSRPFYDLLTTRRSIAWFLQRSFVGQIPDGMVNYSVSTSHQPGAEHAPLYFVAGKLFTPNALDNIYRHVKTPALVIYDQDPYVRFDRLPELLAVNKAWQATRVSPTLGMPHWEKTEETIQALEKFWDGVMESAPATA